MKSRNAFEKRLLDYIIRKLKKTFRLCNSKSNHVYEKSLSDYPETNYKFKKWLPDYVIQNITEGHFWKYEKRLPDYPEANYKFEKWLPDYVIQNITEGYFWKYENLFLKIWKSMEVREEGMEVQEEAASALTHSHIWPKSICRFMDSRFVLYLFMFLNSNSPRRYNYSYLESSLPLSIPPSLPPLSSSSS